MKGVSLVAVVLCLIVAAATGGFLFGYTFHKNSARAALVDGKDKEIKALKRRSANGQASGVRTEKAQAASDTAFQQIRSDYETDKQNNPGIGCVLDPVSLRRWNEANAAGEPDGEVREAADAEAWPGRGDESHRDSPPLPHLPEPHSGLD